MVREEGVGCLEMIANVKRTCYTIKLHTCKDV